MGVFNSLFGGKKEGGKKERKALPWIPLVSVEQLGGIIEKSAVRTQVIFKHSTTCGISRMVMNMFQENYNIEEDQLDLYYLDLHSYRQVSDEAGYAFQVMHQSPQVMVIRNGETVAHASHGAITELDLETYL